MTSPILISRIQTQRAKAGALLAALLFAAISPAVSAGTPTDPPPTATTVLQSDPQPPAVTGTNSAGSQGAIKKSQAMSSHEEWMETMGISLGFVAVVFGIGIGFFAIWADYRKRHELLMICHQERMAALDKGLELPPFPSSLVNEPEDLAMCGLGQEPAKPSNGLKSGLVLVGLGVGLGFLISWKVGALFIGLGVAFLVYYAIAGRKLGADKSGSVK